MVVFLKVTRPSGEICLALEYSNNKKKNKTKTVGHDRSIRRRITQTRTVHVCWATGIARVYTCSTCRARAHPIGRREYWVFAVNYDRHCYRYRLIEGIVLINTNAFIFDTWSPVHCDDPTSNFVHVNVTQPTAAARYNLFALRFSLNRSLNRNVDDFSSVLL